MNPSIHWDGKVSLCTFDAQDHFVMGDLMKENFKEIWWGEAYSRFRRQFRHNYRSIPFCDGCTNAFKGGECGSDVIRERYVFNSDIFKKIVNENKAREERQQWLDLDWSVVEMLPRIVTCQR